jgi:ketosteroid isomerase-like protein
VSEAVNPQAAGANEAAVAAVLAANEAFYAAFEDRSTDAMDAVWFHGPDVVCTHPGWAPLLGWPAVRASWEALLANEEHLQFIVTDVRVTTGTDLGFVSASENLLTASGPQGSVAVINVFARQPDGGWRMVAHHGSPVLRTR